MSVNVGGPGCHVVELVDIEQKKIVYLLFCQILVKFGGPGLSSRFDFDLIYGV